MGLQVISVKITEILYCTNAQYILVSLAKVALAQTGFHMDLNTQLKYCKSGMKGVKTKLLRN